MFNMTKDNFTFRKEHCILSREQRSSSRGEALKLGKTRYNITEDEA